MLEINYKYNVWILQSIIKLKISIFRGFIWKQGHLINIRYNVLVHHGDCRSASRRLSKRVIVLFDADSKYGFRGKQIHNKLANNCKISKNRLSTTTWFSFVRHFIPYQPYCACVIILWYCLCLIPMYSGRDQIEFQKFEWQKLENTFVLNVRWSANLKSKCKLCLSRNICLFPYTKHLGSKFNPIWSIIGL